jgi:hypothetical protein
MLLEVRGFCCSVVCTPARNILNFLIFTKHVSEHYLLQSFLEAFQTLKPKEGVNACGNDNKSRNNRPSNSNRHDLHCSKTRNIDQRRSNNEAKTGFPSPAAERPLEPETCHFLQHHSDFTLSKKQTCGQRFRRSKHGMVERSRSGNR